MNGKRKGSWRATQSVYVGGQTGGDVQYEATKQANDNVL